MLNQVDKDMLKGKKYFAKYIKQMLSKISYILCPNVVYTSIYKEKYINPRKNKL